MRFLVDAHLPRRMATWLVAAGCDAMHTLDLPDGNKTTDVEINRIANLEGRVVITKDSEFVASHQLSHNPEKLLLISTGNISNADLERLFVPLIPKLVAEFATSSLIELGRTGMIIRG